MDILEGVPKGVPKGDIKNASLGSWGFRRDPKTCFWLTELILEGGTSVRGFPRDLLVDNPGGD